MNKEQQITEPKSEPRPIIKDDEIDLIALIKTIWDGRKIIYKSIAVCVVIGLLVAFLSPAKYEVSSTLLPSEQKQGGALGNLGALAGMAGLNLSSMMGETSGIPAEIYPQVVQSYPFLKEMIHQKFHFVDYKEPISIYEYVTADTIESVGAKIAKYTIKLPWTIKDALTPKPEEQLVETDYGVVNLSEEEVMAIEAVKDLLQIEVDNKTGLVVLSAMAGEPVLTAQYVQKATELLQEYIISYKTKQVRENLDFIQLRYAEKQEEYEETQKAFFEYKDRHRNIISERVDPQFQLLSDHYEMATAIYKGLAQQLEQAKVSVKENTPAFSVLEPAKVPIEKSSPNKKIILVLSVFLGGFIGIGIIFGRLVWMNIKANF